ncbi:hypothetical protein ElyMa_005498100 [Elysia marginata]|uniref:Uncharacterized protein n=1 Tax=Elysia marginata TaxID=1093978 RepID=A0AAV4EUC2_9GAST|nr:hypothetical protein ElyMa_005498100 [Elysia marginata]
MSSPRQPVNQTAQKSIDLSVYSSPRRCDCMTLTSVYSSPRLCVCVTLPCTVLRCLGMRGWDKGASGGKPHDSEMMNMPRSVRPRWSSVACPVRVNTAVR